MSLLATIRGTTAGTGANITFTFPTGNIDTTNLLNPGTPTAFDLRTYLRQIGKLPSYNITTRLTIVVPNGATIGSSYVTMPALTIANFKNRDSVKLIVESGGYIIGAGGAAGAGGTSTSSGNPGGNGGTALYIANNCSVTNNGAIYGGGGGGGGGGGYHADASTGTSDDGCTCTIYNSNATGCKNTCTAENGGSCSGCSGSCSCSCVSNYGIYHFNGCINTYHHYTSYSIAAVNQSGQPGGRGQGFIQSNTNGTASVNSAGSGGNGSTYGQNGTAGTAGSSTYGSGGTAGYYLIGKNYVNGGAGIASGILGNVS
jgi:hypothetical protein